MTMPDLMGFHHRSAMLLVCASRLLRLLLLPFALVVAMPSDVAFAQELLLNRSFESPVAPSNGNNLYASIPNWSMVAQGNTDPNPFNIVKPYSSYCCNQAVTTPTGGGSQYLDISGTWGQIRQSFTLNQAGTVKFSGWFSTRDGTTALTGSALYLKNSGGSTVAIVTVDFASTDPAGSWKQGVSENIWLSAGTYYFEAYIPNPANFDLASVQLQTPLSLGSATAMRQCPVTPQYVPGTLAGWNFNTPSNTITQDGYYDSNWSLSFWTTNGTGADLSRLAGQASNITFGPGLSALVSGTVSNLKPINGSWSVSVPTLAAAISTGSYAQVSFSTASSYEASRLVLSGSFNFYTPTGTYQQAAYLSTSPTFSTYTELFRDQQVNATPPTYAIKPLLSQGTTYYIRVYFYNVTVTSNPDGTVIWDDWHIGASNCSSLNPATDSGSGISGTPKQIIDNITSNDSVNGWSAVLGSSGNATISKQGTWPAGILLDTTTGALSIDANSAAGTYTLTYRLCDRAPSPVCSDSTIALSLSQHLTVSKSSTVLSDPVNGTANPKAIPGAIVRYCLIVTNPPGNPTATAISLTDALPTGQVIFQSGTIRINGSLTSANCDYANSTPGGSENGGVVQAILADLPGGAASGLYYDVVVR